MLTQTKSKVWGFLRTLLAIGVGLMVVFAGYIGYQILQNNDPTSKQVSANEIATLKERTFVSVNAERIKNNLVQLKINQQLSQAAQNKADDMIKNNYFSHIRPTDDYKWSDFIDTTGYNYQYAGENLARGYTSVESMVKSWMESPKHRENILTPEFEETGFGIALKSTEAGEVSYVVQMFGKKY